MDTQMTILPHAVGHTAERENQASKVREILVTEETTKG